MAKNIIKDRSRIDDDRYMFLVEYFAEDIRRTETLLDLELSHWRKPKLILETANRKSGDR